MLWHNRLWELNDLGYLTSCAGDQPKRLCRHRGSSDSYGRSTGLRGTSASIRREMQVLRTEWLLTFPGKPAALAALERNFPIEFLPKAPLVYHTVLSRNNLTKTAVNLGQAAVKPRLNRGRNEVRPRLNLGQTKV